jgi:hypothetical protein
MTSLLAALKATQVQAPAAPVQAPALQQFPAPVPQQFQAPAVPVAQQFPAQAPAPQQYPPQRPTANPYAGVSTAELGNRRPKLPLGTHVLKVIQCRDGNFPEAIGGNFFFASDFEIVESTTPGAQGSEASWLTSMGKFPQYFRADVKAFILAATGLPAEMITDETPREATAQNNPLANRLLIAEVTPTSKTNKDGEMIPNVLFKAIPTGLGQGPQAA